ncbi:hypothetical protein [Brucella pituitosa]|uniref:hypothetical protein n=1 Tax=Brucella pituitosa TaxID=571256 RepID=UPI003F4AA4E8
MIIVYDMHGRILWISANADVKAYTENLRDQGYRYLVQEVEADPVDVVVGFYVLDGSLTERPKASISSLEIQANGADSAVITGIPEGVSVSIDDEQYEVSGGSLEFTTDDPGTYRIAIDAWPLMPFEAEVKAL